ncbi:MAG TPA: hypothetical protein VGH79_08665 [Gaiellaceae bacterium]|jgi:hypothetical protein
MATVFVVLFAAVVVLTFVTRDPWPTDDGVVLVLLAAFASVGYVIARSQPRNPIGWVFLTLGVTTIIDYMVRLYVVLDYRVHGGRLPLGSVAIAWRGTWTLFPLILAFPAIVLFPDGRLSPRWRNWLWVYAAAGVVFMVMQCTGQILDPTSGLGHIDVRGDLPNDNGGEAAAWSWPLALLFLGSWIAFVWHQVAAWRSATGVQRAQLKWLALGSAICLVSALLLVMFGDGASTSARVIADLSALGMSLLPVAIGVAILRYRLYEIDRLISRTLAYAVLTALLVGMFAGIVLLTTRVLPFSSPVAVAASTLAAAALFNPLRTRVQRLVDRRFNRARYDRDALVAAFGAKLRDAVDSETVLAELAGAASSAVEPMHVSIWMP